MKYRDPDREYVAAFIEDKGGYMAVMAATGMRKQAVWQLSTKRNGISKASADQFAATYLDFDRAKALGLNPEPSMIVPLSPAAMIGIVPPSGQTLVELATLRAENTSLRSENKRLNETINEFKNTIAQLQEEIRGYARDFRQLAFPMASSFSPVPPQPRQWITGLRSSLVPDFNADEPQCIVRPLWPVSQAEQLQMA